MSNITRDNPDIHCITIPAYTGQDQAARQVAGLVVGSDIIKDALEKRNVEVQPLLDVIVDIVRFVLIFFLVYYMILMFYFQGSFCGCTNKVDCSKIHGAHCQ